MVAPTWFEEFPSLLEEWDSGNTRDFRLVASDSRKSYRWVCGATGEPFSASVAARLNSARKYGKATSPYVTGSMLLVGYNDLATRFPELAQWWDQDSNGDRRPNSVPFASSYRAHWVCPESGGKWREPVNIRVRGKSPLVSPYMSGQRLLAGYNDLASMSPSLRGEWDDSKNECSMDEVYYRSSVPVHWRCAVTGGEWVQSPKSRYDPETGMFRPSRFLRSLSHLFPEVAAMVVGADDPLHIPAYSKTKLRFRCPQGHSWSATSANQVQVGATCTTCAGTSKRVVAGVNDLASQSPTIAALWDESRNEGLSPSEVGVQSDRKVWWLCPRSGASYLSTVANAVNGKGHSPFVTGKTLLRGFNDLATLCPEAASQWHPSKNHPITPSDVLPGSNDSYWFLVGGKSVYRPIYVQTVCYRTTLIPRRKPAPGQNLTQAHPGLVQHFDREKNSTAPEDLSAGSAYKAWWICPETGKRFRQRVHAVVNHGLASPFSRSTVPEREIGEFLTSCFGNDFMTHDRTIIAPKELDFYIPSKKLAVEYHGLYWHTEEMGADKNYHHDKWLHCHRQGVRLIQIWEDDWRDRRPIVEPMLKSKLGVDDRPAVAARSTAITEVSTSAAREFLDAHHVQGFTAGSIYAGLCDGGGELVALSVWGRTGDDLRLHRYATSARVMGGMGKLVAHVERTYRYRELVTFADLTVSDGRLYTATGWTEDTVIAPDYSYLVDRRRVHKFNYRIPRFRNDPDLLFSEGLTERELAVLNDMPRIWDSGKIRYVKPHPRPLGE